MLDWVLGRRGTKKKKPKAGQREKPSYEESKRIAASGDAAARRALAEHEDLEPEFLYFFATDEDASVRRAVAENDGTPLQADLILAKDVDTGVREELAYKIGRLVPTLTPDETEQLVEMAFEVLEILARDQAPQIRAIIADEVKHLDNVPRRLIAQLARDAEDAVAGPILEYSPLLTDEQIIQIVASGLRGGALEALARRRDLSGAVSEKIVAADHEPAVAELLRNKTAEIGEKLMNEIALMAEHKPDLHIPLVDRGSLSDATIRRIATFVSSALVDRLIAINGIDEGAARDLRLAVRERIDAGETTAEEATEVGAEKAEKLHKANRLDADAVLDAIDAGDAAFLRRGLALLSGLSDDHVGRMLESESAKGLSALAWKAGLDADLAVSLQRRIGHIPAKSMIQAAPRGAYRMEDEELQWYVDYFKNP